MPQLPCARQSQIHIALGPECILDMVGGACVG